MIDAALIIYCISVLERLGELASMFALIGGVVIFSAGATAVLVGAIEGSESLEFIRPFRKPLYALCIAWALAVVANIAIPSQKTMYVMLAAYAGQEVLTSDAVGRIAPKSVAVIEKYLDEQLAGGHPTHKESEA